MGELWDQSCWCFWLSFLSVFAGQGFPAVLSSVSELVVSHWPPESGSTQYADVAVLIAALNFYLASAVSTRICLSWYQSTLESLAWGWVQCRGTVWGTPSSGFPPSPDVGGAFSFFSDTKTEKASQWPYRTTWSHKHSASEFQELAKHPLCDRPFLWYTFYPIASTSFGFPSPPQLSK